MAAHPTTQELAAFLGGLLAPPARATVASHLEACDRCRGETQTLKGLGLERTDGGLADTHTPAPGRRPTDETELPPGSTLGRYVVQRRLGQGAMGQVYEAHDPRLDRRVAVKLLRHDLPAVENKPLRQRLEREAQALARLSHPNVVAVHDLGDHGDSLFIAMDYVEGQTLSDWLRTTHDWREVQRVFRQAGAGLAAAHRAGLVHRDFKPDNVLVGSDGVVRVSDFGVSRRVDPGPRADDAEDTITGAGSLIGTPAYMSPEQFDGAAADMRSDQYGFCVALFEALVGHRPYRADSLRELRDAVHRGDARFPEGSPVPRWLQALTLRGLAVKPKDRFPSMDELLVALKGPRRWSRSTRLALAGLGAVALVAAVLGAREVERRRSDPCYQVDERAEAAWGPAAQQRLEAGVLAVPVPWAADSAKRVAGLLEGFIARWRDDYRHTCAEVDRTSGLERTRALAQLACLDARLEAFTRYRDAYEAADARLLRLGTRGMASALAVRGCSAVEAPLDVPTDPVQREAFTRLRARVLEVDTDAQLGRSRDVRAELEAARLEADRLGFKSLAASLRLAEARALLERSNVEAAVAALEDTALRAEVARDDLLVFKARSELVKVMGENLDVKRARSLVPSVRAAKERLGDDLDASSELLHAEAVVLSAEGNLREAIEKQRASVEARGAEDPFSYGMWGTLSVLQSKAGDAEAGLASIEKAKALAKVALGEKHPAYAGILVAEAGVLYRAERRDEAFVRTEEALAIYEKDPDSRDYTLTSYNYGILLSRARKHEEAARVLEKAIATAETLGEVARLATMYSGYAEELQLAGRLQDAVVASEKAVGLAEKVGGADSPQLARPLAVHGAILEELRRYPEAVAVLERALALQQNPSANPVLRDVTRYDLARVRWQVPAQRRQAVDEVKAVRAAFVARGERFAEYVAECDEWLAKHPAR